MKQALAAVAVGLLVWAGAVGCAKSEAGPPVMTTPFPGVAGSGSGPGAPHCSVGQPCKCAGGLPSYALCESGEPVCVCDRCDGPAPVESAAPQFQACGGEPFGAWRIKSLDMTRLRSFYAANCPLITEPGVEESSWLLQLADGGNGEISGKGLSVRGTGLAECLGNTCGEKYSCKSTDCGLCECSIFAPTLLQDGPLRWTRKGSTLVIEQIALAQNVPFCVTGNSLSIDLGLGWLVTFEKVYTFGKPSACVDRPVEHCVGAAISDRCYIGRCSGSKAECAEASTEANCTNQQGCVWNATVCSGEAAKTCNDGDYGLVPGCVVLSSAPSCSGQSQACSTFDSDECPTAVGCTLATMCTGPTKTCDSLYSNDSDCPVGCKCTDEGGYCLCTGEKDCTKAGSESVCENSGNYGCVWGPKCGGTLPDCATLAWEECLDVPGCALMKP